MEERQFQFETLFKALADPTRLRLIHLLGDDELCVCSCVAVLNMNQPKISRHLAYLKRAGLVTARRDGKWTHYRLTQPTNKHAARILSELRSSLGKDPQMQSDRARLKESTEVHLKRVAGAGRQSQDVHQSAAVNR